MIRELARRRSAGRGPVGRCPRVPEISTHAGPFQYRGTTPVSAWSVTFNVGKMVAAGVSQAQTAIGQQCCVCRPVSSFNSRRSRAEAKSRLELLRIGDGSGLIVVILFISFHWRANKLARDGQCAVQPHWQCCWRSLPAGSQLPWDLLGLVTGLGSAPAIHSQLCALYTWS